jgi:hypothetical protein
MAAHVTELLLIEALIQSWCTVPRDAVPEMMEWSREANEHEEMQFEKDLHKYLSFHKIIAFTSNLALT